MGGGVSKPLFPGQLSLTNLNPISEEFTERKLVQQILGLKRELETIAVPLDVRNTDASADAQNQRIQILNTIAKTKAQLNFKIMQNYEKIDSKKELQTQIQTLNGLNKKTQQIEIFLIKEKIKILKTLIRMRTRAQGFNTKESLRF